MENIEINELLHLVSKNKLATIPGYRYLDYRTEILALRVVGVRHRVIADWLNMKTKEDGNPYTITMNSLANIVSRWKKMGLIDASDIENPGVAELVEKIKQGNEVVKLSKKYVDDLESELTENLESKANFVGV